MMLKRMMSVKISRAFSSEMDPIQRLFIEKLREYEKKKKASGGMFDPIPELEEERDKSYKTLENQYFKDQMPEDPTKFPEFTFIDQPLDDIDLEVQNKD